MKKPNILPVSILVIFAVGLSFTVASVEADATTPAGATNSEGIHAATVLAIHGTVNAADKGEKLVTIQVRDCRNLPILVRQ